MKRTPDAAPAQVPGEDEAKYRALLDASPDAVLLETPEGRILDCNQAALEMYGYTRAEMLRLSVADLTAPEMAERLPTIATHASLSSGIFIETVNRRKNGELFPCQVSARFAPIAGARLVVAYVRDITAHKRAEEARHRLEEFNERIIRDMAEGITVEDAAGYFTFVNPAAARLLGYAPEELIGKHWTMVVPPDAQPVIQAADERRLHGEADRYEAQVLCRDGSRRFVLISGSPLSERGRFIGTLAVFTDITARKQAEEQLQQRTEDLTLINTINAAINRGASLQEVTRVLAQETQRIFSSNGTHLYLLDDEKRRLTMLALVIPSSAARQIENLIRMPIPSISLPLETAALYRRAIETKQSIRTDDPTIIRELLAAFADAAPLPDAARALLRRLAPEIQALLNTRGLIVVPLFSKDEPIGILDMSRTNPFSENDLRRVETIATQLTSAIVRKRAEDALRESEDRYRDLVEHSPLVIVTHDLEGQVLSVNPTAQQVLGYTREQICGMNIRDTLTPEVRPRLEGYLATVRDTGTATGLMRVQTQRGEERILEYHSTLRTAGVATPIVRSEARDVTELRRAERALQRRADEFAALYETADALATQKDLNALLQTIVTRATTLLGVQAGAIFLYDDTRDVLELAISQGFPVGRGLGLKLGEGAAGRVAQTRQSLILDDYSTWEHRLPELKEIPFRATLDVPMLFQGKLIGVLDVSELGESTRRFTQADARLLSLFAAQAASAVDNARLLADATRRADSLAALYAFSRALADAEMLDAVCQLVAARATEIVGVTFARLLLLEDDHLIVRAAHPIRLIDRDLGVGSREPIAHLPFCQQVLAQSEPVLVYTDSPMGADERQKLLLDLAQTLGLVPLRVGTRTIGLLMLGEARREAREPFSEEKLALARSIGSQAASAIHRAALREQIENRLKQLQALHTIDMAITASLELSVTLNVLLTQVTTQLRADAAAILILNPYTQTLDFLAGHGFCSRAIEQTHARLGHGHAGRAVLERHIVAVPDLHQAPLQRAALLASEGFCSYYGVPLVAKGNVKGVLEIFLRHPKPATPDWLDLLEALGTQAAIAIDNSEMFHKLQNSNLELSLAYDATIEGWSRALDLRDEETEGHTQRVVEMTLQLARLMNVREQDLIHIRRGALLHDIGKMGIADSILRKPSELNDEEMAIMRRHPLYAYELLSPIAYLRPALDIPYCHHERWDGTGYPRGLRGEEIPLAARIFAIVDVWDALCSQRPYRTASTAEEARAYIREQAGKHFDPQVAAAFLRMTAEL